MSQSLFSLTRFLDKVEVSENGCWNWIAGKSYDNYGKFWSNGRSIMAHRFVYEYWNGSIDSTLSIDHLCRNPSCVNPIHLEQVTIKENIHRGFGLAGINSRKTHCIHGHNFTPENTFYTVVGKRKCRICKRKEWQTWKDKERL